MKAWSGDEEWARLRLVSARLLKSFLLRNNEDITGVEVFFCEVLYLVTRNLGGAVQEDEEIMANNLAIMKSILLNREFDLCAKHIKIENFANFLFETCQRVEQKIVDKIQSIVVGIAVKYAARLEQDDRDFCFFKIFLTHIMKRRTKDAIYVLSSVCPTSWLGCLFVNRVSAAKDEKILSFY